MLEQEPARRKIDELIAGLDDWRGERLAEVRALVHEALPGVVETWKWMGSPVWEQHGIVLVGNAHEAKVKLTFPRGAQLTDPYSLFNGGLAGGAWRRSTCRSRTLSTRPPSERWSGRPRPSTAHPSDSGSPVGRPSSPVTGLPYPCGTTGGARCSHRSRTAWHRDDSATDRRPAVASRADHRQRSPCAVGAHRASGT